MKKPIKSVCVIGLGYIGLPTAIILASRGFSVLGCDINQDRILMINQSVMDFTDSDSDLKILLESTLLKGQLTLAEFPQLSDIYIICVPTPIKNDSDHQPDLGDVINATRRIAPLLKADDLVIYESTCPVGTTEKMQAMLRELGVNVEKIHLAYCPERVFPNKIHIELIENSRIIGGLTPLASKIAADFYRTFVHGEIFETNTKTAELCKLAENSFRDVNIAFANELSIICDIEGINVSHLIKFANSHPRVKILQPSVGVGGHCIAVDPWFIVAKNPENSKLIRTSREVNNYKTEWVIDKIKIIAADQATKLGKNPSIAVMGLSFKPNSNDLRNSPALKVALALQSQGYKVIAVEPNIESCESIAVTSIDKAIERADIVCILVRHSDFLSPQFKDKISLKHVLDYCGALEE